MGLDKKNKMNRVNSNGLLFQERKSLEPVKKVVVDEAAPNMIKKNEAVNEYYDAVSNAGSDATYGSKSH